MVNLAHPKARKVVTGLQALMMIIICTMVGFPCLLYLVLLTSRQLSAHCFTNFVLHLICTVFCLL